MSEEEKQQSLQNLKNYIELDKLATSSAESLTRIPPLSFEERQKRRDYIKNGKYVVYIYYQNDEGFPEKYGGTNSFVDDESPDFYKAMSESILRHYLGNGYKKYEPTVSSLINDVSIKLLIEEVSELNDLLNDQRVVKIRHVADGNVETIVLPVTTK